jgi:hypothetical protein
LSAEASPSLASLKSDRMGQLQQLSSDRIEGILAAFRSASTVPKPEYHFGKHGDMLGVQSLAEYEQAFRDHVQKEGLRVFTYLRPADRTPFWELVDPSTGTTGVYNEGKETASSFFRPRSVERRMAIAQQWWVEVTRTSQGWEPKENWRWK